MADRARPKKIVAVDWDARTLRIVHAITNKRGVKIDKLLAVPIPPRLDPASSEEMGRHIRRTLDQEGITTRFVVADIPRDQVILKTLTLPTGQPDELPGMVEIQIAKELPFPVTGAVIDFAVPPESSGEVPGDVMVAAIRRELLEQYEAIFAAAGLKLDRIGLRPYANKVAACELLKHAMPERVLFIDVRPTFMEIDVLRNSALIFSRSASVTIPEGGQGSSALSIGGAATRLMDDDVEDAVADPVTDIRSLVLEVTRSIEAYRADDSGASIDHVVIAGDVGVEESLAEALQKQLGVTAELYNPASSFGWEPDEGAGAAAFAAVLGLVLGHAEDQSLHFNFLHPKRTVSATKKRLAKVPAIAAVAVLFLAAGAVGLAKYTEQDRATLATLEEDIRELKGNRTRNKKFLDVMAEVRRFDREQHVWIDVLYDALAMIPTNEELVITHIDMKQSDSRMTLKTKTIHRETATEIIREMNQFRREDAEKPRFKVSMGPQTEKKRQRYPFSQELRIDVLDDGLPHAESARG